MHVFLSSAAVVVVAILVYDRVRSPTAAPEGLPPLDAPGEVEGRGPGAAFDYLGRMVAQERRLDALASTLDEIRNDVARLIEKADALRKDDRTRAPDPDEQLDENELERLRQQIDELDRRRERRRMEAMVRRKIELLQVAFSETEHASLLARMVRYHIELGAFWTRAREEAIDDQEVIASETALLRDEATRDVRALLPREKADRVIAGFLATGPGGR